MSITPAACMVCLWAMTLPMTAAAQTLTTELNLGPYPRLFSYRGEYLLSRWTNDEIERLFSLCDGVSMKFLCGDEMAKAHQYANIDRYLAAAQKARHKNPDFLVLEHFLLDSHLIEGALEDADQTSAFDGFFPGHYLYCVGSALLEPVAPESEKLVVADPDRFLAGDYVRILPPAALTETSVWRQGEVVAVETVSGNVLSVRRGMGGTTPRAFPRHSKALPHMKSHWPNPDLLMYNLTRHSARDEAGRSCPDALAHRLASWYRGINRQHHGILNGFEFDVMMHFPDFRMFAARPKERGGRQMGTVCGVFVDRLVDADLDGRADGGYPTEAPAWGVGTLDFMRTLRQLLGNEAILIGDCVGTLARPVPYVNGLMNEDFPDIGAIWTFSAAFQRVDAIMGRVSVPLRPLLMNVNKSQKRIGGVFRFASASEKLRFQTAANLILGAAIAGFCDPNTLRQSDFRYGVADEYQAGSARKRHWLGRPLGPAERIAEHGPQVKRWSAGNDVELVWDKSLFTVETGVETIGGASWQRLHLRGTGRQTAREDPGTGAIYSLGNAGVIAGRDYTFTIPLRAESIYAGLPQPHHGVPYGCYVTVLVDGKADGRPRGLLVFEAPQTMKLALMPERSGTLEIRLHLGWEPGTVFIGDCELSEGACDRFVRRFEHGAVLLNAAQTPWTADLTQLLKGRRMQRIETTVGGQLPWCDSSVNTAERVGDTITLKPLAGLVLMTDQAAAALAEEAMDAPPN